MNKDSYGDYSIFNVYYDTPDFLLIRRSIEKTVYKEKLRVRSYGEANKDSEVFVELKKKYKSVVYKRRITMQEKDLAEYFGGDCNLPETQISKEIDYFKAIYKGIEPRVFISYDREAFSGIEDKDLRLTFDENILFRTDDLNLCSKNYGEKILDDNKLIMEVKVSEGIPLWLTKFLTEQKIYKGKFSKYGTAYKKIVNGEYKMENKKVGGTVA